VSGENGTGRLCILHHVERQEKGAVTVFSKHQPHETKCGAAAHAAPSHTCDRCSIVIISSIIDTYAVSPLIITKSSSRKLPTRRRLLVRMGKSNSKTAKSSTCLVTFFTFFPAIYAGRIQNRATTIRIIRAAISDVWPIAPLSVPSLTTGANGIIIIIIRRVIPW
jgi:hypothetical protein